VKNISLALNIVLLVAVGVLYFLFFTTVKSPNSGSDLGVKVDSLSKRINTIAYVNSDTLLEKYKFFQEEADKLEKKRKKMEADFSARAKGLQSEIEVFQNTAQNMTMNQARAMEEELMKKRQNLMQFQENLSQELMRDEARVNADLYERVAAFLNDYGKKHNLEVVLTYSKGSGVLYAKDSLDITNQVITGLNEIYKSDPEKKEEKKNKK
jgi:outer membrane protein